MVSLKSVILGLDWQSQAAATLGMGLGMVRPRQRARKAVFGTWKSTDDPNHGRTGACNVAANAQTWTNIGGFHGWN